ncbi:hypothetical protein AB4144_44145, partial [Rhizobiaceae sp. 2RAB30]
MTRFFDGLVAARRAELSRRDFARLSMAGLLTLSSGGTLAAAGAAPRLDKHGTAALANAMRGNIDRGLAAGIVFLVDVGDQVQADAYGIQDLAGETPM